MQPVTYVKIQKFIIDYSRWELIEEEGRTELHRVYTFKSFEAALLFMSKVGAQVIAPLNHHPRWENVYNRVRVWLTTHDIGNQISEKDLALAEAIEAFYQVQVGLDD